MNEHSDYESTSEIGQRPPQGLAMSQPYDLNSHLRSLIRIEENDDIVFSFFLNIDEDEAIGNQVRRLGRKLEAGLQFVSIAHLFQVEAKILDAIGQGIDSTFRGIAVHARGGREPFIKIIAFHVPLKPNAIADFSPNIVPLIELKDSYDRYIVLISTEEEARIVEIVLGSVTREEWLNRPELRKRVGREWTRQHYQNHRRDRDRRFVREKIELLDRLMTQGGYTHLVLAGKVDRIAMIEKALPSHLKQRVIDIRRLGVNDQREKVVAETIKAFVEEETRQSEVHLERLRTCILNGGGAAVGLDKCEAAVRAGVADLIILAASEEEQTKRLRAYHHRTASGEFMTTEKRLEDLIELAFRKDLPIEFVPRGSYLDDYDGCGVLLRYQAAKFSLNQFQ
ncbi:MAG: hypothetical protein AAFX93_16575 [Verrucomicrobiota bacterium]